MRKSSHLSENLARRIDVWVQSDKKNRCTVWVNYILRVFTQQFPSTERSDSSEMSFSPSVSLRHRSPGPGEAGATAAHLPGLKLHQQVHTQTEGVCPQRAALLHQWNCPCVCECVCTCLCVLRRASSNDWCLPIDTAVTHPQARKPHNTITADSPCCKRQSQSRQDYNLCVCVRVCVCACDECGEPMCQVPLNAPLNHSKSQCWER